MWLKTACNLKFDVLFPTPFILMLRPQSGDHQIVAEESFRVYPEIPMQEYDDHFGNKCQRIVASPGQLHIATSSEVLTSPDVRVDSDAPLVIIKNIPS